MIRDKVEKLADGLRSMAVKAGAEEAEALVRFVDNTRIEVREGRVEGIRRLRETAAALRLTVGGRPGFSFSTDPSGDRLKGMVEDAIAGSRLLPPDNCNRFSTAERSARVEGLLDLDGFERSFDDKLDIARELESSAHAASKKVRKTHKPSFSETYRTTAIVSGDEIWSFEDTLFSISVEAVAEENEVSQTGFDYSLSRVLDDLDPESVGNRAGHMAADLLGGIQPESGSFPVIFSPRVVTALLSPLLSSLSAEEVQKGRSRLADKAGEKVFSEKLTLTDDGTLPGGVGTVPFDDERVPPQARNLVEKGVLTGFLHTIKTAAKDGVSPTGNGFRSTLTQHPAPGTTNLILQPAHEAVGDLASAGRCMRVESVMGAHTIDRVSGNFSLGAVGFVLDGQGVSSPFRNATVSGNIFDLFNHIAGVGSELEFYGSIGVPALLAEDVIISGK